jgi:hypothetical protein
MTVLYTYRNESMPLQSNAAECRAQEKACDPNPWTNNGTLPVGFEVAEECF